MIVKVQAYRSSDGALFECEELAVQHEAELEYSQMRKDLARLAMEQKVLKRQLRRSQMNEDLETLPDLQRQLAKNKAIIKWLEAESQNGCY